MAQTPATQQIVRKEHPPLEIRQAQRKKAKLRMAMIGPSGSGKTYSALLLAFGLGGRIGMIDTEHGSGEMYSHLGDYSVITLEPPYTIARYSEAINMFEVAGYDTIIIDSLSPAWAGTGGLLHKFEYLQGTNKYKNNFQIWAQITPEHNKLIEALLKSPSHIIATMRTKTEYVVQADQNGKQVPHKVGLAPVQRDQIEYEFTIVFELSDKHIATATKDRTTLFDDWTEKITKDTGRRLGNWLDMVTEGANPEKADDRDAVSSGVVEAMTQAPSVVVSELELKMVQTILAKHPVAQDALYKWLHEETGVKALNELPSNRVYDLLQWLQDLGA